MDSDQERRGGGSDRELKKVTLYHWTAAGGGAEKKKSLGGEIRALNKEVRKAKHYLLAGGFDEVADVARSSPSRTKKKHRLETRGKRSKEESQDHGVSRKKRLDFGITANKNVLSKKREQSVSRKFRKRKFHKYTS